MTHQNDNGNGVEDCHGCGGHLDCAVAPGDVALHHGPLGDEHGAHLGVDGPAGVRMCERQHGAHLSVDVSACADVGMEAMRPFSRMPTGRQKRRQGRAPRPTEAGNCFWGHAAYFAADPHQYRTVAAKTGSSLRTILTSSTCFGVYPASPPMCMCCPWLVCIWQTGNEGESGVGV